MNHVEQAVAAIRNSPSFALMNDDEPVTVESLQAEMDSLSAEWGCIEAEITQAEAAGDSDEVARLFDTLKSNEEVTRVVLDQFVMLEAAIARDAVAIH